VLPKVLNIRGPGAAVGNVRHFDAGPALEQLAGEMGRGAGAGRRERRLAAVALGEGDEFRDRLGRRGIRNRHQIGIGRNQRHRREIGERIIAERRKQKAIDRKRQRGEQHGVAVGRRMGDRLGADIGAAAALVLDDDLVARGLRQSGREDASDGVGPSAGDEGNDDPHHPLWPILRRLRCGALRPTCDRPAHQR